MAQTQSAGESVSVVSQAQILQVTPVQVSPESSVESSPSITITATTHTIQGENEVLTHSPESCDESGASGLQGDPGGSPHVETTGHFITVTTTDTNPDDVTHSYVQYVEGTEQAIYTTSNGQMYPVYTVGESGAMYTASSAGHYYSPPNSTPVTYAQVATGAGGSVQLGTATAYLIQQAPATAVASAPGDDSPDDHQAAILAANPPARASPQTVAADVAYLVNPGSGGGASNGGNSQSQSDSESGPPNILHATRVSPVTVQWLLENYETAEGVSLPRSTLYSHYLRHCYDNKLDPVNAASFGKLIRSVFLGLKTRRLGTRGNSKYHYYGIRIKAGSQLNQLVGEEGSYWGWSGRGGAAGAATGPGSGKKMAATPKFAAKQEAVEAAPTLPLHGTNHEFLGDGSGAVPDLPEITLPPGTPLPPTCSLEDIDTFRALYREHCEAFLDAIINLDFATVETLWREFWRSQDNNNDNECEDEKYLSKAKLMVLCKLRPIQEFVKRIDYQFYQNLVQVLIPDVLRPIPSSLTQTIRNFAKGLESWLSSAMAGCPTEMVELKVGAVCAFGQTLRRYTSLNHLAQAARAVLQNSVQINQMLTDLNRVDFHNVQEQASWVCQCDAGLVARLEADFKATLQQQNSLEQWAAWLKAVVATVLKPYLGRPNFTTAARQLLLKWSFYSSMVIRDLTLRSAASFGSFHLIRLLYDEYMFYLIEHQVAHATGETPIAVMGDSKTGGSASAGHGQGASLSLGGSGVLVIDDDEDVDAETGVSNVGDPEPPELNGGHGHLHPGPSALDPPPSKRAKIS